LYGLDEKRFMFRTRSQQQIQTTTLNLTMLLLLYHRLRTLVHLSSTIDSLSANFHLGPSARFAVCCACNLDEVYLYLLTTAVSNYSLKLQCKRTTI